MSRRNNNGMSLVEIIVVIAIIGIMIAMIPISFSSVFSAEASQCANGINTILAECRVSSMSRAGDIYVRVICEEEGIYCEYYENDLLKERDKIGTRKVSLVLIDSTGATNSIDTTGEDFLLAFNRSTGSMMNIGDAEKLFNGEADENSTYYTSIRIAAGDKVYIIDIDQVTGNHEVRRES